MSRKFLGWDLELVRRTEVDIQLGLIRSDMSRFNITSGPERRDSTGDDDKRCPPITIPRNQVFDSVSYIPRGQAYPRIIRAVFTRRVVDR